MKSEQQGPIVALDLLLLVAGANTEPALEAQRRRA